MASTKNTNRNKRKYGDRRQSITAANKAKKSIKHTLNTERLIARTQALIGQRVKIRTQEGPEIGTVQAILTRPEGAIRRGQYLRVITATGRFDRARSRAKIIQPTTQGE